MADAGVLAVPDGGCTRLIVGWLVLIGPGPRWLKDRVGR